MFSLPLYLSVPEVVRSYGHMHLCGPECRIAPLSSSSQVEVGLSPKLSGIGQAGPSASSGSELPSVVDSSEQSIPKCSLYLSFPHAPADKLTVTDASIIG